MDEADEEEPQPEAVEAVEAALGAHEFTEAVEVGAEAAFAESSQKAFEAEEDEEEEPSKDRASLAEDDTAEALLISVEPAWPTRVPAVTEGWAPTSSPSLRRRAGCKSRRRSRFRTGRCARTTMLREVYQLELPTCCFDWGSCPHLAQGKRVGVV